jgi:hypothetical protein
MIGTTMAADPTDARSASSIHRPAKPAASNHSASTDSSARTTSPIPKASRAHGARCVNRDVLAGFFGAGLRPDGFAGLRPLDEDPRPLDPDLVVDFVVT